jgi:hypothetical protein
MSRPWTDLIICDIDGVVADCGHRLHFIANADGSYKEDKDWRAFDKLAHLDKPIQEICDLINTLYFHDFAEIVFVTGRADRDNNRKVTEKWLRYYTGITSPDILMRPKGDVRSDHIVKAELWRNGPWRNSKVLFVLEDRQCVVDMWREEFGFRVLQTDKGDF